MLEIAGQRQTLRVGGAPVSVGVPAAQAGGGFDNELCLELAFREREPTDRGVVAALRESVAYWAPFTSTGYNR